MRVVGDVIYVGMTTPAGVHDLAGSQDGTSILPFSIASCRPRGTGRKLLAHVIRQTEAAACAGVAVGTTGAGGFLGFRRSVQRFEEIGMVLDLGRGFGKRLGWDVGRPGWDGVLGFVPQAVRREGVMGGRRRVVGREIRPVATQRTGEGQDLGAEDGGGTMHLAEVGEREL